MSEPKSHELVDQFAAGQAEAARVIFDRYVARVLALARSRIGSKLQRRIDPEDVAHSAFRSFFVHAKDHEYQLAQSGDLWRLLAGITLNKLYGQIEKHTAAKRHIGLEDANEVALSSLAAREPSGVEVVAMAEQLGLIMASLSADERQVLELSLRGQSVEAIASGIGKSERTVRRLYDRAKKVFEDRLLGKSERTNFVESLREEPLAPLRFADLVLEQLIGEGSMGKVYRATDKRTGKKVAVKTLRKARQSDGRAVAQFVQESQVLAGWRHPHIVGIAGLGRFPGGGYFIVMDFVAGMNLQSRLALGPVGAPEAVRIVKDVARAIQYAHEQGVVHCDLKPGNVLLDGDGHVFVTDFGFAYILKEAPERRAGAIGGTLGFVAPEVLVGGSRPTPAADVYAIGALLWVLLTGRVPGAGEALSDDGVVGEAISAICRRCLAVEPDERFASAGEVGEGLKGL
jgi:eukaryotic-like serine/threonine-protein kinase